MRALFLNGSLKRSNRPSRLQDEATPVLELLEERGVHVTTIRLADWTIPIGTGRNCGRGDQYPEIEERILLSNLVIFGTPVATGVGTSVIHRLFERMESIPEDAIARIAAAIVIASYHGPEQDIATDAMVNSVSRMNFRVRIGTVLYRHGMNPEHAATVMFDNIYVPKGERG